MRVRLTIECDMPPEYLFQIPRLSRHLQDALGESQHFDNSGLKDIDLVGLRMGSEEVERDRELPGGEASDGL